MRRIVSGFVLTLLLTGMLASVFNVSQVKADGSWVWVRDTVTGAYGEAVVGTGKALYIASGASFYRYLPADNSFVELASPPKPDGYAFKTGTALAWDFNDYIYALFGAASGDRRSWFYRYSVSSNSWESLANTTADQGEGNAVTWVSIDNCVYATVGGEQRPTCFMRYDPSTNSWSDAPADPPAGMGDGASLVWTGGENVYALRGEFLETSPLYDFWRYSLHDDVWTVMADVPALPHDGGSGGVGDGGSLLYVGFWLPSCTDYIYALSGNQAYPDGIPDNRTYRYTISTGSWERVADLPFGVGYYVGCRLGYADGHVYAWQGAPSTWTGGGDNLAEYKLSWIVDDDGPADFHTIQEAINAANPGDTIYVRNGTYYENVVVNKTLSLLGENRERTIIDPRKTSTVILVSANNVSISNFTVRNSGSGTYDAGIFIEGDGCEINDNHIVSNYRSGVYISGLHNTLYGNNITSNSFDGVRILGSFNKLLQNDIIGNSPYQDYSGISIYGSHNIITGNNITDDRLGIWMDHAGDNRVSGNYIAYNSWGIYPFCSSDNVLSNNIITSNYWDGIEMHGPSDRNLVVDNVITSNYVGIFGGGSFNTVSSNSITNNTYGIDFFTSYNNMISGNNITTNREYGINLREGSSNNTLSGNLLATNNEGIILQGSKENVILSNALSDNIGYAIKLTDFSDKNRVMANNFSKNQGGIYLNNAASNIIFHNNFLKNSQQVISVNSQNIWDDGYPSGGNCWSDYNDTDIHRGVSQNETGCDGIGDRPYIIDENNKDNYPLMTPYPDETPPRIVVISPENRSYASTSIPLIFTLNESTSWMGYSLNGQANVTITGNTTLSLSEGSYWIRVYANATHGNMGYSDIIPFTVDTTPPITLRDYDGLWRTTDFTITLTATDDMSGVAETYYKINNGPVESLSVNGQPFITTESANNTLEYWSVDNAGNEELPHKTLTGIKLDKTVPTIGTPSRIPEGNVEPDQNVKVLVNVTDSLSGVKNVILSYNLNDSTIVTPFLWIDVPMTLNSTTGLYETTIPGQSEGILVRYEIAAYDNAGNRMVEDNSGQYYVYTVIPEFPSTTILPLLMLTTLIVTVLLKKKRKTKLQLP